MIELNKIEVFKNDSEEPISDKDKLLFEINKAIWNGIKDLVSAQSEPCEDAVSRQAVYTVIEEVLYETTKGTDNWYGLLYNGVRTLPSVTPKPEQRWIPCSKTVDIPDHEILACDKYGEEMFGYLAYEDEQWLCESDGCVMYDPIAWREKPEPYREEGGE